MIDMEDMNILKIVLVEKKENRKEASGAIREKSVNCFQMVF